MTELRIEKSEDSFSGKILYKDFGGNASQIGIILDFSQFDTVKLVKDDVIEIRAYGDLEMDGFVEFCREVVEKYDHYKQIRANLS